jgi:outer membrane protein TolC
MIPTDWGKVTGGTARQHYNRVYPPSSRQRMLSFNRPSSVHRKRTLVTIVTLSFLQAGCAQYHADPLSAASAAPEALADTPFVRDYGAARSGGAPFFLIDLSQPLTDAAVASLAVMANPDLKAQRARAGVNDAQVYEAGLMPDPTISLGLDHILSGPDPVDALIGALGIDLNALRTRAALRAKAEAERRQVRMDLLWAEWQTAGQARLQAVRIDAMEKQVQFASDGRRSAESLLARYTAAAGRGDIAADQLQTARIAATDAQTAARQAEKDLAAARLELNRLLGLPPGMTLRIAPRSLPPIVPDADTLIAIAIGQRTDLGALREGYVAQEAALRKAVLDQFPMLDLTVNAGRDTGKNVTLGPAIGFTLPLWNRNRGGIAIEKATRAALRAEYDARLFQTRAEIAAAVKSLAIARAQYAEQQTNLPAAQQLAAASSRAAKRGDLSDATAQTAQQVLRDRNVLLNQSAQDIAEQTIALELLTGAPREQWK